MSSEAELVVLSAAETRPLRQAVLRPHQDASELVYDGDDDADSLHVGMMLDAVLVGIASIYRQPPPRVDEPGAWRLRGMATLPEVRGLGYGRDLLLACTAHARERGGERVWANARTSALGFYSRLGFAADGDPFELPGIGEHYRISLTL